MLAAQPPYGAGQPLPGSPYRLLRVLGAGGTAIAYEAEDTSCGRPVVVKIIRPEIAARGTFTAQHVQREARTLVQLQQDTDHVVEVITAGVTDDDKNLPYYVMERLDGYTLRHGFEVHLSVHRMMAVDEVAAYAIDVATALHHAHRRGIVHRDVKPENAFVHRKRDGSLITKLLDFGISALIDDCTGGGQGFRGTYRYAAPEQINGYPATPATDLYALGLVLFEALTLKPTFEERGHPLSVDALAYAHTQVEPVRVATLRPDVPPSLDELVARCLAKNPQARPESAEAMLNELRRARTTFESRLVGHGSLGGTLTDVGQPPSFTRVAPVPSMQTAPQSGGSHIFFAPEPNVEEQGDRTEVEESVEVSFVPDEPDDDATLVSPEPERDK